MAQRHQSAAGHPRSKEYNNFHQAGWSLAISPLSSQSQGLGLAHLPSGLSCWASKHAPDKLLAIDNGNLEPFVS